MAMISSIKQKQDYEREKRSNYEILFQPKILPEKFAHLQFTIGASVFCKVQADKY